jgi:hypothetical protein
MPREKTRNLFVQTIKLDSGDPYSTAVEEPNLNESASPESRKFEVRCHAGDAGHLEVASDSVSVRIGQRIRRNGGEEVWGSLLVECNEKDDGSLAVEVLVYHPDWDEPLRIASIQSDPSEGVARRSILNFDFQQKRA